MHDDLDTHLRAFGDTLARETGEPIHPTLRLERRRRVPLRMWAGLGAAACVVALVAGLVIVAQRDEPDSEQVAQPPATTQAATSDGAAQTSTPVDSSESVDAGSVDATSVDTTAPLPTIDEWLATVPVDPLSLDGDGWTAQDRQGELLDIAIFAEMGCASAEQVDGVAQLASVHEWFQSTTNGGLDVDVSVVALGAGDADRLVEIFAGLAGGCSEFAAATPIATSSTAATGLILGDEFALVIVTPVGTDGDRAVLLELESQGVSAVLDDVIVRAAQYVAGEAVPAGDESISVDTTATTAIESRPITDAESERVGEGGRLDCGHYTDTLALPTTFQFAPQTTAPFEGQAGWLFWTWRVSFDDALRQEGLRPPPDAGWVELVESDTRSTFVLMDGERWLAIVAILAAGGAQPSDVIICDSVVMPEPTFSLAESVAVGQPQPAAGPDSLVVWVSNQSFTHPTVEISVEIDGRQVVSEEFDVEGQHNWVRFDLTGVPPGQHFLLATSETGAVLTEAVVTTGDAPVYAVVDYWADDATAPQFTFTVSEEPISFD